MLPLDRGPSVAAWILTTFIMFHATLDPRRYLSDIIAHGLFCITYHNTSSSTIACIVQLRTCEWREATGAALVDMLLQCSLDTQSLLYFIEG